MIVCYGVGRLCPKDVVEHEKSFNSLSEIEGCYCWQAARPFWLAGWMDVAQPLFLCVHQVFSWINPYNRMSTELSSFLLKIGKVQNINETQTGVKCQGHTLIQLIHDCSHFFAFCQ